MKYLLNVTFFVGSTDIEDTDRWLYIAEVDREVSYEEMTDIFEQANENLQNEDNEICYDKDGLNIDTLIMGVEEILGIEMVGLGSNCGANNFDNCYVIEQWV